MDGLEISAGDATENELDALARPLLSGLRALDPDSAELARGRAEDQQILLEMLKRAGRKWAENSH